MQLISLNHLHNLLADCYAVSVTRISNRRLISAATYDTLYFVGYDDNNSPYISDNDGNDYIDLSEVDGDIELYSNHVFFYVQEQPLQVYFLELKNLSSEVN